MGALIFIYIQIFVIVHWFFFLFSILCCAAGGGGVLKGGPYIGFSSWLLLRGSIWRLHSLLCAYKCLCWISCAIYWWALSMIHWTPSETTCYSDLVYEIFFMLIECIRQHWITYFDLVNVNTVIIWSGWHFCTISNQCWDLSIPDDLVRTSCACVGSEQIMALYIYIYIGNFSSEKPVAFELFCAESIQLFHLIKLIFRPSQSITRPL